METLRAKKAFICDMDGVIYHGHILLPGVTEFVEWMQKNNKQFLFLTNNSQASNRELRMKLQRMGLDISEDHFYTAALATADFLARQGATSAYVIGDAGLTNALYNVGISINDVDPEYVVVGETSNYNFNSISKAVRLVNRGAKLVGTNPDMLTPTDDGEVPACKPLVAPIEAATGKKAYFIGKPNALMMRVAMERMHKFNIHSSEVAMIGDNMETDIVGAVEGGLDPILVLSGVSTRETIKRFAYQPRLILNGVGDIVNPDIH